MRSMHPTTKGFDHRPPALNQAVELQRLALVQFGNLLELGDFLLHQRQVGKRPEARSRHLGVAVQCLAADNYALVGFGWGHGEAE